MAEKDLKDDEKVKILVCYHKKERLVKNNCFIPIHVGRRIAKEKNDDLSELRWLEENTIGDDTGDNISYKNGTYCELTAIYWAWKNQDKLNNPQYIGLNHYRRFFYFGDTQNKIDLERIQPDYLPQNLSNIFGENLIKQKIFADSADYDLIAPYPRFFSHPIKDHFVSFLSEIEKEVLLKACERVSPELRNNIIRYLEANEAYLCNLFIMKKELFNTYAKTLFDVLNNLENICRENGQTIRPRIMGYYGEIITGCFISGLIHNPEIKSLQLPVINQLKKSLKTFNILGRKFTIVKPKFLFSISKYLKKAKASNPFLKASSKEKAVKKYLDHIL